MRTTKEEPTMARVFTATILAASIGLGGCMNDIDQSLRPHMNPSIHSVNEPVVQRSDYVFDVAAPGSVPTSELQRLDAWFSSLGLGYGDRISVDPGAGFPSDRVEREIADVAASYGMLLTDGAPVTAGQVPAGSVRVVVSRSTASVPGCPQWDPSEIGARLTTSPNYGCAVNSNWAAMVADPNDLVAGQPGASSVDAATAAKAIRTYRTRPSTGATELKQESTGGAQQ